MKPKKKIRNLDFSSEKQAKQKKCVLLSSPFLLLLSYWEQFRYLYL